MARDNHFRVGLVIPNPAPWAGQGLDVRPACCSRLLRASTGRHPFPTHTTLTSPQYTLQVHSYPATTPTCSCTGKYLSLFTLCPGKHLRRCSFSVSSTLFDLFFFFFSSGTFSSLSHSLTSIPQSDEYIYPLLILSQRFALHTNYHYTHEPATSLSYSYSGIPTSAGTGRLLCCLFRSSFHKLPCLLVPTAPLLLMHPRAR